MAAKKTSPTEATAAEKLGTRKSPTSSDGWSVRRSWLDEQRTARRARAGPRPRTQRPVEAVLAAVDDAVGQGDQAEHRQQPRRPRSTRPGCGSRDSGTSTAIMHHADQR